MKILLSAFACDPFFGSDEEVGWQWAAQLSKTGHDVSVITRESHKPAIEKRLSETNECRSVNFIYHDISWLHTILSKINRRNHIYYYFWQWSAASKARGLYGDHLWDIVHHVTWVSIRQPSFMWRLPCAFYFGPVAGGDEVPKGYTTSFSLKERFIESVRRMANSLVIYDPLMRMTYRSATKVTVTSPQQVSLLPSFVRSKVSVALAIGTNINERSLNKPLSSKDHDTLAPRFIFAGRLVSWKGMHIGLRAFSLILQEEPNAILTIVGDGIERGRLQELAANLNIAHAVVWHGWLSKDELAASYASFDVLFYPSLRDSGAFVVIEALEAGIPVVCFNLGGPGVIVDNSCGEAVAPPELEVDAPRVFAEAAVRQLQRLRRGEIQPQDCRRRAGKFTWAQLVQTVYPEKGEV